MLPPAELDCEDPFGPVWEYGPGPKLVWIVWAVAGHGPSSTTYFTSR